jgi:hypothetical protein
VELDDFGRSGFDGFLDGGVALEAHGFHFGAHGLDGGAQLGAFLVGGGDPSLGLLFTVKAYCFQLVTHGGDGVAQIAQLFFERERILAGAISGAAGSTRCACAQGACLRIWTAAAHRRISFRGTHSNPFPPARTGAWSDGFQAADYMR